MANDWAEAERVLREQENERNIYNLPEIDAEQFDQERMGRWPDEMYPEGPLPEPATLIREEPRAYQSPLS